MSEPLQAAADELDRGRSFVIPLHESPDGDSVGSALAMGLTLMRLGRRVDLVTSDPVPSAYRWLPGADLIRPCTAVQGPHEVALLLDCSSLERAGGAAELAARAGRLVNIDHHPTNDGFGDFSLVDPAAAAVAEILAGVLEAWGRPPDRDVATCLYTGLLTDSGSFRFANTTAHSLETAGRLVRRGADPAAVAEAVYEHRSPAHLRLLGRALQGLQLDCDARLAWVRLLRRDFAACGAGDEDVEGIVGYLRTVDGVEVAALFRETGEGRVKVGFRSRSRVDAARLAARFGGGGHSRAAGCWLEGPDPWALAEQVLEACRRAVCRAWSDEGGRSP